MKVRLVARLALLAKQLGAAKHVSADPLSFLYREGSRDA
jgi:hypothetical protein